MDLETFIVSAFCWIDDTLKDLFQETCLLKLEQRRF